MFRSRGGQRFLDRIASHVDLWRGYGAGAYIETSGERVLFELTRGRHVAATNVVIFDVGANVGEFSVAAFNALGENIMIHAFEPARQTFEELSTRVAGNDHIVLNKTALGREENQRALYGVERDTGMASLFQRHLGDTETPAFQENVKVISLNDYCCGKGIGHIDLLKIDVEGFELEVLAGAEPLFNEGKVDMCSFEFGGCNLDSRTFLRDFFEFFTPYGMDIFRITPAATIVGLPRYHEQLEKFTTTNYVAIRRDPVAALESG